MDIYQAIDAFPKTVEQYSTKASQRDVEKVVSTIDRIKNTNPPVYNERAIAEFLMGRSTHLTTLVDDYFVKSMSEEFPLIDDKLFELKRHLTLVKEGRKYSVMRDNTELESTKDKEKRKIQTKEITIPLFAYTPLFGDHISKLGTFSNSTRKKYDAYGDMIAVNERTSLEAKLPGSI